VDSVIPAAIVLVLVVLNGLFVAAEFAIVGAPRLAIERRARAGQRLARLVQRVMDHPREQDRFIATAQLGITLASLGLGMYGEHRLATWIEGELVSWGAARWVAAHAVATVTAIVVLTYLHIVVGEMIPKSLALQRAERTVLWIAPVMIATQALFYPLVVLLNSVGNLLLRLLGVNRQEVTHERYYTAQELELVVRESEEAGALTAQAGRLLQEIFEFGDLTAGGVMSPRVQVVGIAVGSPSSEVEAVLRKSPHTRYPVYQDTLDNVIGMIHVKNLLPLIVAGTTVGTEHAQPIPTLPETAPVDDVLSAMRRGRAQMALVIDEHGGMAGIVTLHDLFEEVVGDLDDATPDIYVDAQGRVRVPGTARLGEVGERFSIELEHELVDTVGGLVLELLGRPPAVGDEVSYAGLDFHVTAVLG
jgi:CBS domain containing-hemolysin-like protein